MGLVGSSLALSVPAGAVVVPTDPTPTENYVPKSGYTPGPRAAGRLTPATGALFGSHSDEMSTKYVVDPATGKSHSVPVTSDDQRITKLEAQIGRTLDIDNHYTPNFDYYVGKTQLDVQEQLDLDKNRIPLIGWACTANADILSGSKDASIDAAAAVFKAYPRDLFMRYCWEMDGSRQPTSVRGNPDEFIKAWQYIYKRFRDVDHVTNVVWVWTANANGYKMSPPEAPKYYPGDDYVDWISADGYNWHGASGRSGQDRYRNFLEIYDNFMLWARAADDTHQKGASTKPIMVAEYGTQEQHDDGSIKADWYHIAHATVMPRTNATPADCKYCGAMSDIQAMVYFDVPGKSGNWYVNTTPKSLAAYKEAANLPWFNQIQTLTWGPYTGAPAGPGPTDPGPTDPGTNPGPDPGTTTPPGSAKTDQSGRNGYWMLGSDGKVYAFGQAKHLGAPPPLPAGITAADLETTPTGNGYWIVDTAGNVYGFGDAGFFGGIPAGSLAAGETVTSLSSTPSGQGYWIFTTKGRAVRFGDATFFGDMSRTTLAGPVLDSIPTPTGLGYYMVGSDGGIFAFGDAKFYGSMGGKKLNAPVQSLVPDSDGIGYWLVASDGGIFAFDAPFKGSMGDRKLAKPVTGMVPYGTGYMMVGEDGGIFNFSDRPFDGSLGATPPTRPIVSVSALA